MKLLRHVFDLAAFNIANREVNSSENNKRHENNTGNETSKGSECKGHENNECEEVKMLCGIR